MIRKRSTLDLKAKKLVMQDEEGPLQNPDIERKLIVFACVEGDNPCHKIFDNPEEGIAVCRAYVDPAAVQNNFGLHNACPIRGAGAVVETVNAPKKHAGQGKTKRGGNR